MKNKIKRTVKYLWAYLLAFSMLCPSMLGHIVAYAAEDEATTIACNQIQPGANYFTYEGAGWVGGASEYYANVAIGEANASNKYYTIQFIGNSIELFGVKAPAHGKLEVSIDGGAPEDVSTHHSSRTEIMSIYRKDGLEEGSHVIKVAATGENVAGAPMAVIQINRAVVRHKPYAATDFVPAEERITMLEGSAKELEIHYTPSYAWLSDIAYESGNEHVVTVDESGRMEAQGPGSTQITISSEAAGISRTVEVTVEKGNLSLTGTIVDTNEHYTQDSYRQIVEGDSVRSAKLYSWKNDKAISEIILASREGKIDQVRIAASDFVSGEHVIFQDQIRTTFLKETLAYIGDGGYHNEADLSIPEGYRTSVPDILYTEGTVALPFESVQPVWVELQVPAGTPAGKYEGTITVHADDLEPLDFHYELEVLDLEMPGTEDYSFDVEYWQYPYSSAEYYGIEPFSEQHIEILKAHMTAYKKAGGHAITASIVEEAWGGQTYSANDIRYPSMVKWTKKADGTFAFDYDHFDKWVQLNKDLGIGDKIVCYSMIPWGNQISYYDEAAGRQQKVTVNPGTTAYEELWTPFLASLIAHLDEKGWFEETYIGIDERANMDLAFNLIERFTNKDGKELKKAAAMDHFSTSYKPITDRVDDLSVGSTAAKTDLNGYKNFVKERSEAEHDYKTTIYTCTEHFPNSLALSMPCESYWTMMFSAAQGATGYMRWAFDAWVADPLRDTTHWAFEAGDTFLIYPAERDDPNPVSKSSVRLEKQAEGVRDVNKLYEMKGAYPALKTDVDQLLSTVVVDYAGAKNGIGEHGGAKYATAETRVRLPSDMNQIKASIKAVSEKYVALNHLSDRIAELEAYRPEDYTGESFQQMQQAVQSAKGKLNQTVLTMSAVEQLRSGVEQAAEKLEAICTCKIEKVTFEDQRIQIGYREGEKQAVLHAAAQKAECRAPGHAQKEVVYGYQVVQDTGKSASIAGNRLTVKVPGEVQVKVTASIPDTNARAEATAIFTVSKEAIPKPGTPVNVKVSGHKEKSLKVSWGSVPGATGYLVERYDSGAKRWKEVRNTTVLNITDGKLRIGTVYKYRVKAYSQVDGRSVAGDVSKVITTATKPAKPKVTVKKLGGNKVKVSWKKNTKADRFEIWVKAGKKGYKKDVTKGSNVLSVTKKLKKGVSYAFKIRGFKKAGGSKVYGSFSKPVKVKVK